MNRNYWMLFNRLFHSNYWCKPMEQTGWNETGRIYPYAHWYPWRNRDSGFTEESFTGRCCLSSEHLLDKIKSCFSNGEEKIQLESLDAESEVLMKFDVQEKFSYIMIRNEMVCLWLYLRLKSEPWKRIFRPFKNICPDLQENNPIHLPYEHIQQIARTVNDYFYP